MEQIVEQLLRSPKLEIYLEQINAARVNEKAARQRYLDEITEDEKAEFINGQVIIHSPVKFSHGRCVGRLGRFISTFVDIHRLGTVGQEHLLVSLTRNDYEPDLCFWRSDVSSEFQPNQMRFPAPDLIVEVLSPSTEAIDRGLKFEDYAAHNVREYWLVDPDTTVIEQYKLNEGKYEIILKSSSGFVRSTVIAAFEIPVAAIFDDGENLTAMKALHL